MVSYKYENGKFIINDFQHAKRFSSFLPAIAGKTGKPLWAFYANIGQCMGGFGITDRNTPITPFDSATLAYQNILTKGFRTFLKLDGKVVTPFFYSTTDNYLAISKTSFTIFEETPRYSLKITYSSVSNKSYPGLLRKVEFKSKVEQDVELVDGLTILFPKGLSNSIYKDLVSLMSAYCQIDMGDNRPFVKFKTSTKDASIVELAKDGNGFVSIDFDDERLTNIVELSVIYGDDNSLIKPVNFESGKYLDLINEQQTENQLPCAYSLKKKHFMEDEEYEFITLFSSFDTVEDFEDAIDVLSFNKLDDMIKETEDLVDSLLPHNIHTSNPLFDDYIVQSVLDNNLRGGFPTLLDDNKNGQIYYLYSRKHGDMERDYNFFSIPSLYYSSGPGNFRDVNQNRRSDLYFLNEIKDYNIYLFFNLIQVDGQNPLTVKPLKFVFNGDNKVFNQVNESLKDRVISLVKSYYPSELYTLLKDNEKTLGTDPDLLFKDILGESKQVVEASFGEGYWVDHWTYNVDLLLNYTSVYPDKLEELLFRDDYQYFYSHVYVEPRDEKYCLREDGKIRQYGALDLANFKKENEKLHLTGNETLWLKDKNGNVIKTTLASKIFNLALVKFSTLDAHQMGIEMECEKPGWNDAMNGLPGLFSSAMSESIELLRLINYLDESLKSFEDKHIEVLEEQFNLFKEVESALIDLKLGNLDSFTYWDKVTSAREELRLRCRYEVSGKTKSIKVDEVLAFLNDMEEVLTNGIKDAKKLGGGIIPSYIINEVSEYEPLHKKNHLGFEVVKPLKFKQVLIPYFLEASARMAKLGQEFFNEEDYEKIYASDLRDQTLGLYKTCADIEDAPFEIGRVHAFTKGWLERECDFLHMAYKYLLGLLKAGLYEDFYREAQVNLVYNMDPYIYGRSPIEASSFIVPTCNPNKALHGQGFFARLTGANAEVIDMFFNIFVGPRLFTYKNNKLTLSLEPKLPASYFDKNDEVSFELFNKVKVIYHNPKRLDCYKGVNLRYRIDNTLYDEISGLLAEKIRNKEIKELHVEIY